MTEFVVKIQIAQFPKGSPAMVYPEDRRWCEFIDETDHLRGVMRDRPKAFFMANVSTVPAPWAGIAEAVTVAELAIDFDREVEDPGW